MVNLSGDAAERFDVVAELLELDADLDGADIIDLAVYILEGVTADSYDALLAEQFEDAFDRQAVKDAAVVQAEREAAKAAHPSNRVLVEQFSRGLDYSLLAEGHNVDQEDDCPCNPYPDAGSLASDEALAELRAKLTQR